MLYPYRKSTWIVIIFLLVIWPAFSVLVSSTGEIPAKISNLTLEVYLPALLIQIFLMLMVVWALIRGKGGIESVGLVGFTALNFFLGILLYLFAQAFFAVLSLILHGLGPSPNIQQYLPKTSLDVFFWFILSISAAIVEEVSFRGFLITRLNAVLGNFGAAALLSSAAFALGHKYQGSVGVIFTGIYGLMFSVMFFWRKSIFPCMIAHFLQDALTPWLFHFAQSQTK